MRRSKLILVISGIVSIIAGVIAMITRLLEALSINSLPVLFISWISTAIMLTYPIAMLRVRFDLSKWRTAIITTPFLGTVLFSSFLFTIPDWKHGIFVPLFIVGAITVVAMGLQIWGGYEKPGAFLYVPATFMIIWYSVFHAVYLKLELSVVGFLSVVVFPLFICFIILDLCMARKSGQSTVLISQ